MPKIMSADEFVMEIIERYYTSSFSPERTKANCALIVRSRDSAMLEKYKIAIATWMCKNHSGGILALLDALDLTLAEVEGPK